MPGYQCTVCTWITLEIDDTKIHYVILCQVQLRQLPRLTLAPAGGTVWPGVVVSDPQKLLREKLLSNIRFQQQEVRQLPAYPGMWLAGWQQVAPILGFEQR
jgi:hypothetical protein